jgi:hypothetical protein
MGKQIRKRAPRSQIRENVKANQTRCKVSQKRATKSVAVNVSGGEVF